MSCAENVKSVSMSGFGGNGAGCGADEEPFCGAADAAPDGAAAGDAQSVVAFVGERGGLLAFIGEVVLGGGELGLAGFAVDGEVVKRLQVFGGKDGIGLGRWGVLRCWGGLQSDGGWKRNSSEARWERSRRSARQEKWTARASRSATAISARRNQYRKGMGASRVILLVGAQHAAPLHRECESRGYKYRARRARTCAA